MDQAKKTLKCAHPNKFIWMEKLIHASYRCAQISAAFASRVALKEDLASIKQFELINNNRKHA